MKILNNIAFLKVLEYRKRAAETTAHLSTLSTATQNNKTSDISPDHFSPQNLFLLNRFIFCVFLFFPNFYSHFK